MLQIFSTLAEEVETSSKELDRILISLSSGDMQALEVLYSKTRVSVYSYALSVLKNVHDAEDVLHDCYVNVYSAAGSYRTHGKPLAWILTIAKNLCFQKLREQKKSVTLSDEDWDAAFNESGRLHFEGNMTSDDRIVLKQCMQLLSDDERKIVVLHAVSGFKHREIADFLNMPLPTVLSKYRRALTKLKENYLGGEQKSRGRITHIRTVDSTAEIQKGMSIKYE